MAVNNKIPAEDVVRKHKSTKIRRTREPDSNVTVYVRLPCATLLIVYEDIGFLYVCSVFTRYRIRKMRCALAGFALKSRSDRATLSLERDRSFASRAFSYLCSVRRDVPSDWPVSQGDSRESQRYPFPPTPPRRREEASLARIWSTFLHAVYAINNTRPSALDLVMRRSACESGEGMDAGYISQSPGVSLDEGVKQVLSVALPDQSETQTTTSKF